MFSVATVNKCLTFPPFPCRIYTSVPAAPFGPSSVLWDRETGAIIDLWPYIKPQMTSVFDMDLTWLKRFDPVLSLTESDRQRNVWFMFLPVETVRQRRDQNRKWLKPLLRNYEAAEWISGNPQLISCKHLIWWQNTVAFYLYYFCKVCRVYNRVHSVRCGIP